MSDRWCVYVIFDVSANTKVGMTGDLSERARQIKVANPTAELAAALHVESKEAATEIERLTHRALRYRHESGEWFGYSVETAVSALSRAAEAWNLIMQHRQDLAGLKPSSKYRLSPTVDGRVELFRTRTKPVSEMSLVVKRLNAFLERLSDIKSPLKEVLMGMDFSGVEGQERLDTLEWLSDLRTAVQRERENA